MDGQVEQQRQQCNLQKQYRKKLRVATPVQRRIALGAANAGPR
jgi:hypothetical protein